MNVNDLENIKHIRNYASLIPYNLSKQELYTAEDLYQGFDPEIESTKDSCTDALIYKHYIDTGKQAEKIEESLCRAIHDHGMHIALKNFFRTHNKHK